MRPVRLLRSLSPLCIGGGQGQHPARPCTRRRIGLALRIRSRRKYLARSGSASSRWARTVTPLQTDAQDEAATPDVQTTARPGAVIDRLMSMPLPADEQAVPLTSQLPEVHAIAEDELMIDATRRETIVLGADAPEPTFPDTGALPPQPTPAG